MNKLNRYSLPLLMCMVFLLPFWLTFGRGFLGSAGWGLFIYLFTVAPVLLLILLTYWLLLRFRRDVQDTKSIGTVDSLGLLAFYAVIFFHGFFFVDGGDTAESVRSVATIFLGMDQTISSVVAGFCFVVALLLVPLLLALFIMELVRKRALDPKLSGIEARS